MKKLIIALICTLALCGCGVKSGPAEPTASPSPAASAIPSAVRTEIAPSQPEDYATILAETSTKICDAFADITLSTDAERGEDGYMMWDDSQSWALNIKGEKSYSLFNSRISGKAYFDVTREGKDVVIMLYTTSAVGTEVTSFTCGADGVYKESIISASPDGNSIYSSFPEYIEQ